MTTVEDEGRESVNNGDISELKIQTKLKEMGHSVSVPVGNNDRYDLIADIKGELHKVQCKTGFFPPSHDSMQVELRNRSYRNGGDVRENRYDETEIDSFAIYNPNMDEIYWMAFEEAPETQMKLNRSDPSDLSPAGRSRARFAKDFLIEKKLPCQ